MDQYLSLDNKDACRLCMKQIGNISLFNNIDSVLINERLFHCLHLQVLQDDRLPQYICDVCNRKLDSSYNFKCQIQEVDSYLKEVTIKRENGFIVKDEESSFEDLTTARSRSGSPLKCSDDEAISLLAAGKLKTEDDLEHTQKFEDYERNDLICSVCNEIFFSPSRLQRHFCGAHARRSRRGRPAKSPLERSHKRRALDDFNLDELDVDTKSLSMEIGDSLERDPSYTPLREDNKEIHRVKFKRKSHECSSCHKTFRFRTGLANHKNKCSKLKFKPSRVNYDQLYRPFVCEQCGRSFKQRSVLQQHQSTHLETKQYSCALCKKMFTRSAHLLIHQRIHENVKPCVCEMCGRRFTKTSDLRRHCRVHSEVRNYPCPFCDKTFKRSGDVVSHKRLHTGDRPFRCSVCDKSYSSHSGLKKHQRANAKCFSSEPIRICKTSTVESEISETRPPMSEVVMKKIFS